jgi:hypothetical protein
VRATEHSQLSLVLSPDDRLALLLSFPYYNSLTQRVFYNR